jgi:hypothetical protein
MNIPDEAVEAAAQALRNAFDTGVIYFDEQAKMAVLAAAPFLLARGWDEGFIEAGPAHMRNYDERNLPTSRERNPYRSQG